MWWQWEGLTDPRQATRADMGFTRLYSARLGSRRLAVGKPDLHRHANSRDDIERYMRYATMSVPYEYELRHISRRETKLWSALEDHQITII